MMNSRWLDGETCFSVAMILWHVTWSGAVVALAGTALARWGTRRAAVRYGICCATLGAMVGLIPVWGLLARSPREAEPLPSRSAAGAVDPTPLVAERRLVREPAGPPAAEAASTASFPPPSPPEMAAREAAAPVAESTAAWDWIARGVTVGYLAGLLAMLVRLVLGMWGGERLRAAGQPVVDPALLRLLREQGARLGLRVIPLLRTCERVAAPVVVGLLRPVVLVPRSMLGGLTAEQFANVLMHELAHLRRADHLVLLGQRTAEAILFFHPAVWVLSRLIDRSREEACDDLVLARGGDAVEYAESLLRVAELRVGRTAALATLSVEGTHPSELRRRIARVLGMGEAPAVRLTRTGAVTLMISTLGTLALALTLAADDGLAGDDGPAAPAVARFPEGIEVELMGVAPSPSDDKAWWRPDGSPLADRPSEKFGGGLHGLTPEEEARSRELWIVVRGVSAAVRSHVAVDGEFHASAGGSVYEPQARLYTISHASGMIDGRDETTVRLGLSLSDALPPRRIAPDGKKTIPGPTTAAVEALDGRVRFQQIDEVPEGIELRLDSLGDLRRQASIEFLAIDTSGREVRATSSTGRENSNGFVFKLTRDQLSHFAYRLRPYTHRVTFEGVAMKAGAKARPKASHEVRGDLRLAPRLELRLVAQPPDGTTRPAAPDDWETRDYPVLDGSPIQPDQRGSFVWVPLRRGDLLPGVKRPQDSPTLGLPLTKTVRGETFALLSDRTDEALRDDGGWKILSAMAKPDPNGPQVHIELDEAGGKRMRDLTGRHVQSRLAVVVDGRIVMAPVIMDTLGGTFVITGAFTLQECEELAALLAQPAAERLPATVAKPASVVPVAFIKGRVVTPKGEGIPLAEVAVTTSGDRDQPVRILADATAGPDGEFEIPLTADLLDFKETVGLWARAAGHVPLRDNFVTFIKTRVAEDNRVKLFPAGSTTVAFLDKDRRPVEHAMIGISKVQAERGVAYRLPEPWLADTTRPTDADGRVTVPDVSPEIVRQFDVRLPDGTAVRFDPNFFLNTKPQAEAPHFTIPAPEVGRVAGELTWEAGSREELTALLRERAADGNPVQIHLSTEVHKPPFGTWAGITGGVTLTLTEPTFAATLPAGVLSVTTSLTADQPLQPQVPPRLQVKAGETTSLPIPILQGVKVRGAVRKGVSKEGIPDYRLRLIYGPSARDVNDQQHSVELTTDANGVYTAYVPPGPVRVRLNRWIEGYRDIESWNDGPWNHRDKPLLVPAGSDEFELPPIDLDPTKTVKGTLVDTEGKPLVDWTVYGFPTEWQEQYRGEREPKSFVMNSFPGVSTDRRGAFEGDVPASYPPGRWRVSHRVWKTKFESQDHTYIPRIRSSEPLVLEVDVNAGPVTGEEDRHRDNEVAPVAP